LRSITLIGFDDGSAKQLTAHLAAESCRVSRKKRVSEVPSEALALLVSGDDPGWALIVREARSQRPDIRVAVVTPLPDSSKWLDAIEAGAHDYCCLPPDRLLIRWLLGRDWPVPEELSRAESARTAA